MNIKLDPSALFKVLLGRLNKLRGFLVLVLVLSLVGYTGYLFSQYAVITPTNAQIEAERKNITSKGIKFDTKTIDALVKQNVIPVNTLPTNVGKTDPFF